MSTPSIPHKPLVRLLLSQWETLDDLLAELPEEQWSLPTCLPGWSVADIAAHLIGTEAMLAGEAVPRSDIDVSSLPHVHNDIAAVNELWVLAMRPRTPGQTLERFREVVAWRSRALAEMSQADFDAPSWTPAGDATYGRFMQVRLYDCWMHEQDIREATGRPGHTDGPCAEAAVDEVARALGYIVGKRAGAPSGCTVRIELTGPVHRRFNVAVNGRANLVSEPAGPATATIRLPSDLFMRLAGGRCRSAGHECEVRLEGDAALAQRIVDNLAFTR